MRLFIELQLAMALGALTCLVIGGAVRASSLSSVYRPGTPLFFLADVLFLMLPAASWVLFRRGGRRAAVALTFFMLTPVTAVALVGKIAGLDVLVWMVNGMYPLMTIGIVVYLLAVPAVWRDGGPRQDRDTAQ